MDHPVDPIEIFSAEVWGLIIGSIVHPKEIMNCRLISKFFRDLLTTERVRYLFPKAIKIVSEYLSKYNIVLSKSEIISLRAVCRTWKYSLDSSPFGFRVEGGRENPIYSINEQIRNKICRFTDSVRIDKFCTDFQTYGFKNELDVIGKYVSFGENISTVNATMFIVGMIPLERETRPQVIEEYWNSVCKYLKIFGGLVEYLKIIYPFKGSLSHTVERLLLLTPNINTLEINNELDCRNADEEGQNIVLPPLKYLNTLILSYVPTGLTNALFQTYKDQISKIVLKTKDETNQNDKIAQECLGTFKFSKLKTLDLVTCSQANINLFRSNVSNLKELCIGKQPGDGQGKMILNFLDYLAGTKLEKLVIREYLMIKNFGERLNNIMKSLLELKELSMCLQNQTDEMILTSTRYGFLFNFFGHLQKLEYLAILVCDLQEVNRPTDSIDIYIVGYLHKMYESKIWSVCPKLKSIYITGLLIIADGMHDFATRYSRLEYERKQKAHNILQLE